MSIDRRAFCLTSLSAAAGGGLLWTSSAAAQAQIDHAALAERAVRRHIIPAFERLEGAAQALSIAVSQAAQSPGGLANPANASSTHEAFFGALDAWGAASHLRFGATEEDGRGFAIAFWPDGRGRIGRALAKMIAAEDPIINDAAAFSKGSIAARGLFAFEALLFDPKAPPLEGYRARLVEAIATDLARTAKALTARWRDPYGGYLLDVGSRDNPLYRTPEEATLELYKALVSGLEFNADMRLGRPLGSFKRPRPRRAEGWRSGRSVETLTASMTALEAFYRTAFEPVLEPARAAVVATAFETARREAALAPRPLHEAVTAPVRRVQIEALKQRISDVRRQVEEHVGVRIGAGVTFNSLDGD